MDELQSLYAQVSADQPVISYCNTGHWATTNWFVLSEVLNKDVKLYDGSMVEWSANADNLTGKSNLQKIKGIFKSILVGKAVTTQIIRSGGRAVHAGCPSSHLSRDAEEPFKNDSGNTDRIQGQPACTRNIL